WTVAVAGVTSTDTTGMLVTVIDDVPLLPSLVAVIVAEPGVTAVTRPLPFTVATDVLLLDQETARPESAAPFAACGVAVSWTVSPAWTVAVAGVTSTDATAAGGPIGVVARSHAPTAAATVSAASARSLSGCRCGKAIGTPPSQNKARRAANARPVSIAGGPAGLAVCCGSPVALRHRLS